MFPVCPLAYPDPMTAPAPTPAKPAALILWRLLSMLYDLFPVLALWMVAGAVFAVGYTLAGHDSHENIRPFSALQWLLWLVCWVITGVYSTVSWRRGGQTLGMRPWRLRVVGCGEQAPEWKALWIRYAVGTLSLAAAGLGFWWAWFDRERLTWHDRASATRTLRLPKRKK
jgi:uncharacterized RDD family membrane protein YckC